MTKPRRFFLLATATLLVTALLASHALEAAKPGGGGGGNPPPLPQVRYRITYPLLPNNTTNVGVADVNNRGQVVGGYVVDDAGHPFLYDPAIDPYQVLDLGMLVTGGIPEGWRLRSASAINEWMVVLGSIEKIGANPAQRRPVAIDMATETPIVDLLPDVGTDISYGIQINENGDILGAYMTAEGWGAWTFNPGLYGKPQLRAMRDGTPLNMSGNSPVILPLTGKNRLFTMNNPVDGLPAQVAGVDVDGLAFRYTLGNTQPEYFPNLNLSAFTNSLSINDSGTFSGVVYHPKTGKQPSYWAAFRYTTTLSELPQTSSMVNVQDMNSSSDLIFYDSLYRDDWGSQYVKIDDLVVGTQDDLDLWFSGTSVDLTVMSDRRGDSNSADLAGLLYGVADFPILVVLTPESAQ